jgi:hypothetical protein
MYHEYPSKLQWLLKLIPTLRQNRGRYLSNINELLPFIGKSDSSMKQFENLNSYCRLVLTSKSSGFQEIISNAMFICSIILIRLMIKLTVLTFLNNWRAHHQWVRSNKESTFLTKFSMHSLHLYKYQVT